MGGITVGRDNRKMLSSFLELRLRNLFTTPVGRKRDGFTLSWLIHRNYSWSLSAQRARRTIRSRWGGIVRKERNRDERISPRDLAFLRSSFLTVRIIRPRSRTAGFLSEISFHSQSRSKNTSQTFVVITTPELDVIVFARAGLLISAKRIQNTIDIVFTLGEGFWKKERKRLVCDVIYDKVRI